MNKTRFVLLASPRTGSTALRLLLNSHPLIRCHDEVLLKESGARDAIGAFAKRKGIEQEYKTRDYLGRSWLKRIWLYWNVSRFDSLVHANNEFSKKLLADFLHELFEEPNHPGPWSSISTWHDYHQIECFEDELAVGFKLMYYELGNRFLRSFVSAPEISIVHLVRENKLEIAISNQLAVTRNRWHSEGDGAEPGRIRLDTHGLVKHMCRLIKEDSQWECRLSGPRYLKVLYEDFRADPSATAMPILDFLGVPRQELKTPLKKIAKPPAEMLLNYDEVKSLLARTPYERFL